MSSFTKSETGREATLAMQALRRIAQPDDIAGTVTSFNTRAGAVTLTSADVTTALAFTPYSAANPSAYQTAANVTAALAPYALTTALTTETTRATTAEALLAPLASPALTGIPTAPTATAGTATAQLATTAFVSTAVAAGVTTFNTRSGTVTLTSADVTAALTFTPYSAANPSGFQTAASVATALSPYALTSSLAPYALTASLPVASTTTPVIDGTATAGVAAAFARGDHVHPTDTSRYAASNPSGFQTAANVTSSLAPYALTTSLSLLAPLASPTFSGTPAAPTATAGTNTTQLATTAFVTTAVSASVSGVASFNTRTGTVTLTSGDVTGALGFTPYNSGNPSGYQTAANVTTSLSSYAPLASPALTGTPTAPTATGGTNTTQLATTAFVTAAVPAASSTTPVIDGTATIGVSTTFARADHVHPTDTSRYAASNPSGYQTAANVTTSLGSYAPLASPALTGTPTAPTATAGTNTTQLASTAFTTAAVGVETTRATGAEALLAPLASPALTGTPTAPTATAGTNTTQLASTAFTTAAVGVETARATAAETAVQTIAYDNIGRNKLHNPLFNVAQRGAGPFTTNGAYTADRWTQSLSTSTLSTTLVSLADTDRTAIGDEEAQNGLQVVFGGTSGAGDYAYLQQRIESVRRLSNKTVTLSFWARATSGTPKIGYNWTQFFGSGGSPSAQVNFNSGATAALSTTWTRYSITVAVPSASGKTLGTAGDFTSPNFWFTSGATNNAAAGGIGVQSGTIQLWGVQLEIGPVATAIEKLGFSLDFINCQRFYQTGFLLAQCYNPVANSAFGATAFLPVVMRAAPTTAILANSNVNMGTITPNAYSAGTVTFGAAATAVGYTAINVTFSASADL